MTDDLIMPALNVNGSGRENLGKAYCAAQDALDQAYIALDRTCHMRDFYTLGKEKSNLVLDLHLARLNKLREVSKELDVLYRHLVETLHE